MKNIAVNKYQLVGLLASIAGIVANLLGDWVSDRKLEETVESKVAEALGERK